MARPTSGSSGRRVGGMALAGARQQPPRRLRPPLSHTVGQKGMGQSWQKSGLTTIRQWRILYLCGSLRRPSSPER